MMDCASIWLFKKNQWTCLYNVNIVLRSSGKVVSSEGLLNLGIS
uniref:Uncharacterized protein n=1 Tax=Anguilla anguilla TaxID=7936 RepID=A0A0E9SL87_ANGAN